MDKQMPYLVLQNVNPQENKYRMYLIQLKEEQGSFVISLSRGRKFNLAHHKEEFFDAKPQFLSFLKSTIEKRKRHGYNMVEMSFDFPLFDFLC